MLEGMFHKLLYMSFSAIWLAVAVLALRVVLRKAPRRVLVLLWALVAVRLICPVSIESSISLVPRPETVVQSVQLPETERPESAPELAFAFASISSSVFILPFVEFPFPSLFSFSLFTAFFSKTGLSFPFFLALITASFLPIPKKPLLPSVITSYSS